MSLLSKEPPQRYSLFDVEPRPDRVPSLFQDAGSPNPSAPMFANAYRQMFGAMVPPEPARLQPSFAPVPRSAPQPPNYWKRLTAVEQTQAEQSGISAKLENRIAALEAAHKSSWADVAHAFVKGRFAATAIAMLIGTQLGPLIGLAGSTLKFFKP